MAYTAGLNPDLQALLRSLTHTHFTEHSRLLFLAFAAGTHTNTKTHTCVQHTHT